MASRKTRRWEGGAGLAIKVSPKDNFMSSITLRARQFIFSSAGRAQQAREAGWPGLKFLQKAFFWKSLI